MKKNGIIYKNYLQELFKDTPEFFINKTGLGLKRKTKRGKPENTNKIYIFFF